MNCARKLFVSVLVLILAQTTAVRSAEEVLLWPNGAPGSEGQTSAEVVTQADASRLSNVHKPSLTVFLPAKEKATGAAVVIMPGGGHRFLTFDNEGTTLAQWLAERGVAGLVLKYRLSREPNSPYKMEHSMQDADRAVRVAKLHAKEWNLDPDRIGVMGFSAGGELAAHVGTKFEAGKSDASDAADQQSSRPAFQALIYAQIPKDVPEELAKNTPPGFIVVAADDKPKVGQDTDFFRKLNTAGVPAELHVFAQGGHGFGVRERPLPVSSWPTRFYEWLDNQKFLKPLSAKADKTSARNSKGTPPAADTAVAATAIATAKIKPADDANPAAQAELDRTFKDVVHPFLATYCTNCHSGEKPKAEFDLAPYANLDDVVKGYPHWLLVLEKLHAKEMPPEEAKKQPTADEVQRIVAWMEAVRTNEMHKKAGDPGIVLARRLSNAEYNYTIRDLTGVDILPTREFPQDPANTAGFDNSGETLVMSPSLLSKYLKAARDVASYMFLKPDGFAFAPHPMLVETDRDKYCVGQIIDLYHRQDIDLANYFQAAWQYKNRAALGKPEAALADFATGKLSAKYLTTLWSTLEVEQPEVGPLVKLQSLWKKLPAGGENQPDAARPGCEKMRDYVLQLRKKVEPRFLNLAGGGRGNGQGGGGTAVLIWKNVQYATHRMTFDAGQLQVEGEPMPVPLDVANEPNASGEFGPGRTVPVINAAGDPDLVVPAGERARYEAAFAKFCRVFPDKFYMEERGRNYFDMKRDRGRYLSAGFHSNVGYFRDDQPLYELILDEKQQQELDGLWVLFDFMGNATERMYLEGGAGRRTGETTTPETVTAAVAEAPTSEAKIKEIEARYVASAGNDQTAKAGKDYYEWVNNTLRRIEKARTDAEASHLKSLLDFAQRAYRRPLTKTEQDDLLAFYRAAREKDGMDHESAIRESIAAVLMSPDFCYRIDLVESGPGVQPLSDTDLASRLSYFLWSSMPDQRLVAKAAAGELHKPEVLAAEAKRMLKDPRIRELAVEFGGNWLDIRHFGEISTVDRERFPSFTPELRDAMFEEPVRLLTDVIQQNRPILDLLYAKDTFVNPVLAKHYGMPAPNGKSSDWVHIEDASRYERGGLLPMAVFLTKNAPGLRTSPVKRGNWVVKNVLGERIPPPPAVVPELPRDEAKSDLPLRDMLAQHRADKNCAGCHARFDSFGLVFEGFGPVGERREKDLAGRPVDISATFPNGSDRVGLDGLRSYIRQQRQNDFVDNFCGKLLACGLGRSLALSDEMLIREMRGKLEADDYRFEDVIESIVTSPQFLSKRGREDVAAK